MTLFPIPLRNLRVTCCYISSYLGDIFSLLFLVGKSFAAKRSCFPLASASLVVFFLDLLLVGLPVGQILRHLP